MSAGLARLIATCVSFALCLPYLLIFPFTGLGMAVVIGLGTIVMGLLGSTGGHCHDGDYDLSRLGSRSAEHAAGLAPTDSSSRRYPGRDRGWSFVQVACLVRFLSSRKRARPMTELAMPSANSWFGIRLLPSVLSLTAGSMDVIGFLGLGSL